MPITLYLMKGLLLFLLLPLASRAAEPEKRKSPELLPAQAPAETYRVVVDGADEGDPKEEETAPPAGQAGVKRHGLGRLVSVDAKERKIVLEHEDGVEESFGVPETARLSFAADERPLKLDQLRRGDAVAYAVDGNKVARLHFDVCGDGTGGMGEDVFSRPPPRRMRRGGRPPPPPMDEEPEYRSVDEPDVPMYQSEPPEPPPSPKKAPKK